jgi:hypothetical protein
VAGTDHDTQGCVISSGDLQNNESLLVSHSGFCCNSCSRPRGWNEGFDYWLCSVCSMSPCQSGAGSSLLLVLGAPRMICAEVMPSSCRLLFSSSLKLLKSTSSVSLRNRTWLFQCTCWARTARYGRWVVVVATRVAYHGMRWTPSWVPGQVLPLGQLTNCMVPSLHACEVSDPHYLHT